MRNIILALMVALMGLAAPRMAIATVSNGTNQVIYTGDGVKTNFPFSFNVYNSGTENDLVVQEETTSSGAITNLILNTDYTVALNGSIPSAGSITLTAGALAVGKSLSILRQLPLTQLVKEADNSPTPAAVRNNVYDRNTMISQQLQSQLTRAVLQSVFSSTSITLPDGVANFGLCWDATGMTISNCALLTGAIAVPIANSNLQTLTASSLVNGSSLFGTGTMTSLSATNFFSTGNIGVGTAAASQGRLLVIGGNVGIGSATPGQVLDVAGTVRATNFSGSGIGITAFVGTRVTKTPDGTVYQAATDGHVEAWDCNTSTGTVILYGYTDSSNPPTTIVQLTQENNLANTCFAISFTVKKNDYYKVTSTGSTSNYMSFVPLGS